jgi:hypothetical protein
MTEDEPIYVSGLNRNSGATVYKMWAVLPNTSAVPYFRFKKRAANNLPGSKSCRD